MRAAAVGTGLALALALLATTAPAQMGPPGGGRPGGGGGGMRGGRGGMRGGPGGMARMRDIEIKRERLDKLVEELFRDADVNKDGIVTPDEVHAVLDSRRDAIIRQRFARIDTNRDKLIQPDEFLAWQRVLGTGASEAESDDDPEAGGGAALPGAIDAAAKTMDDRIVQRLIGPLDAVAIAGANKNYDAGASLDELLAFERAKFDAADKDHDGKLNGAELRAAGMVEGRRPGGFGGEEPPDLPRHDGE